MQKSYTVIIKETWYHYLKIDAHSTEEAIKKVDGGKEGEHVKVEQLTDSYSAYENK